MSKHRNRTESPPVSAPAEPNQDELWRAEPKRKVKKAQQCPTCYEGLGGIGKRKWQTQVNGILVRRCYLCDRCGSKWTVEVRLHTDESVERLETTLVSVSPLPTMAVDESMG